MKYTIGTDDLYTAMHLMALTECFEHTLGYATLPALGAVTALVDSAGEEFARIASESGMMDGEPLFESKDSPLYGAMLDLQQVLRRTEARLSRLIDTSIKVK